MIEIKVGETYLNSVGEEVEVLFISPKGSVLHVLLVDDREASGRLMWVQCQWKELPKKRVLIELFACMTNYGGVFYCDKDGNTPDFNLKSMNGSAAPILRIPNMASMCIDSVTYEVVGEP